MQERKELSDEQRTEIMIEGCRQYQTKRKKVLAIQYDGTMEMAMAIESLDSYPYVDWDEAEHFCGLRVLSEEDIISETRSYADSGDYIVKLDGDWIRIAKEDFENRYEKISLGLKDYIQKVGIASIDREGIEKTGFIYNKTEPGLDQDCFELRGSEFVMDYNYDINWCRVASDIDGDNTLFAGKIYTTAELHWVLDRTGVL